MRAALLSTLILSFAPESTTASTMQADTAEVSTIAALGTANEIAFSSIIFTQPANILLQGSNGRITLNSSMTAASFWGDGHGLAGAIPHDSTPVFSAANIFTSSFAAITNGREIVLSTSSASDSLRTSPSGAIIFWPELHNSSTTTVPRFETTNSTFGPCIPGSTITIASGGGRIEVQFTGIVIASGTAAYGLSFLQDGAFVGDLDKNKGIVHRSGGAPLYGTPAAFSYLLPAPLPGVHSYCLSLAAFFGGNNVAILLDNDGLEQFQTLPFSNSGRNLFIVREIK